MPRHSAKLNALAVQRASKPGLYCDGGGLNLRVSPTGTKSWALRYMLNGRAREMGLGPWPLRSLAEAREKALEARRLLLDGKDPIEARKETRNKRALDAAKAISFDRCAKEYIEGHKAGWKNPKHAVQWENSLTAYASPVLGKLSVSDIDTALIMRVLQPIWERIPETAGRVRNRIEAVLNWATVREYRAGENPARWRGHLDKLLPKRSKLQKVKHFAALPFAEIPEFMTTLRTQSGVAALALEFAILTAVRSGEARGARWEEINLKDRAWIIPPERMKAGREHRIPLSPRAIEILESRGVESEGLIFSTRAGGPALSDMSLTAVIRRMKKDVTTHGFRSTFRDWTGERTAYPSEVAEMALAHVIKNKSEAAYRRGDFFEKRRKLMESWASYCAQPAAKGNVVGIKAKEASSNARV